MWRAVETMGNEVASLLTFIVMVRLLAPEVFGVVAIATAVIAIIQIPVVNGLAEALIQRPTLAPAEVRAAFAANLGLGVLLVGLAAAIAWPLAIALDRPGFPLVFLALAPVMLLHALSLPMHAMLRRRLDFRAIALRTLLANVFSAAAGIGLALGGAGVWALIGAQWVAQLSGFVILLIVCDHRPWRMRWDREALAALTPVALPVALSGLSSESVRRLDSVLLALFVDDRTVGIYFMISRIIRSVQMVTQHSIGEVGLAVFSRLQGDPVRFRSALRRAWRLTTFACLFCFGLTAVLAPALVPTVFGAVWAEAVQPLQVVAFFATTGALVQMIANVLVASGAAAQASRLSIGIALVQLCAIAVAAPYGLVPLAFSVGLSQLIVLVPVLRLIDRRFGPMSGQLLRDVSPLLLLLPVMAAAAHWWRDDGTLLHGGLAGAGFALLMLLLGAFVLREDLRLFGRTRIGAAGARGE